MKTFASVIIVAGLFLTAAGLAIGADQPHAGQNLKDAKWSPALAVNPSGPPCPVEFPLEVPDCPPFGRVVFP